MGVFDSIGEVIVEIVKTIEDGIASAWDAIASVFSNAPAAQPCATCPLAGKTMTDAQAQKYMDDFKKSDIPFDYPTDCCYARARLMCDKVEKDGYNSQKFWYGGNLNRADLHPHMPDGSVVSFPDAAHPISWRYHVAPLVPVQHADGTVENMILDPSLSKKPLSISEWKSLVGTTSDPREYTSDSSLGYPWQSDGSVAPANPANVMTPEEAGQVVEEHKLNRDSAKP